MALAMSTTCGSLRAIRLVGSRHHSHGVRRVLPSSNLSLRKELPCCNAVEQTSLTPTSTLESSVDEAAQSSSREALSSLGISPLAPEELFDSAHVQQWTPLLLAYLPLGCLLAIIRMAAWVGGIALDASWFRNRSVVDAYMNLLGVKVQWQGEESIPSERHVLVSNHISTGDLLVLFQRPQHYIHLITTALPQQVYGTQNLPVILQPANKQMYLILAEQQQQSAKTAAAQDHHQLLEPQLMHSDPHLEASSGSSSSMQVSSADGTLQQDQHLHQHAMPQEEQQQQQQLSQLANHSLVSSSSGNGSHVGTASANMQHSSSNQQLSQQQGHQQPSVHLFPEGGMTNGRGMMRFSRGFMLFADKLPVVPVALRIKPAFPQLNSHTVDSSFLANLFWFSFQPWTVIEAKALPAMQLAPGESKAAFVQRVQLAIAEELGVWIADLNIQQKRQLAGIANQRQRLWR